MAVHIRAAQPSASRVDRGPNVELPPKACPVINHLHQCLADAGSAMRENQRNAPHDLVLNVVIGHTWRRLLVENPNKATNKAKGH